MEIRKVLESHAVTYTVQPDSYRDMLPFGNGKFGGFVYRPSHWEWVINHLDIDVQHGYQEGVAPADYWSRNDGTCPSWKDIMDAVRRKDLKRLQHIDKTAKDQPWRDRAQRLRKPDAKLAGQAAPGVVAAFVRLHPLGQGDAKTRQTLQLHRGTVTGRAKDNGAPYRLETLCDPDSDLILVHVRTAGKHMLPIEKIAFRRPDHALWIGKRTFSSSGNRVWLEYTFINRFRYAVMLEVDGPGVKIRRHADGFDLYPATSRDLTIRLACATCLDAPRPVALCRQLLSQSSDTAIRRRGRRYWKAFWQQCAVVRLGNDFLENLYYVSRYAFACSSGKGMRTSYKICGLYGLWTHDDFTIWGNGVFSDVNIEMAYQHVFSSNLLHHFQPFVDMVWAQRSGARYRARQMFKVEGAAYGTKWLCAGPWYCSLLWDYYLYSGDEQYLREKAYPIMQDVAEFYASLMQKDAQDRYFTFGSAPPERTNLLLDRQDTMGFAGYYKDVTIDLAFLKKLYGALIEAGEILGTAADRVAGWRDILKHFPEYPTGQTRYGKTIFEMAELNNPSLCYHPNTLAPVYPAGEFHLSSPPKLRRLAEATVRSCIDNAGGICWYTFNAPWAAAALARLGLGDEAEGMLHRWVIDTYTDPSGLVGREHGRFYIPFFRFEPRPSNAVLFEAFCGLVAAVNEMLIQTHQGVVFLFPALPASWRDASFERMRVPGAFLVSAERRGGEVVSVEIQSDKGGELKVHNIWGNKSVLIHGSGGSTRVNLAGKTHLTVSLRPGQTLRLRPASAPARVTPLKVDARGGPRERVATGGYRLFIGKDDRSRIIEAVDGFCFPKKTIDASRVPVLYCDYPQNLLFKLDFGAGDKTDYAACFNSPDPGDVCFARVLPDTVYNDAQRHGWVRTGHIRRVLRRGASDALTGTALRGKGKSVFRLFPGNGEFQVLVLHGGSGDELTVIEIPELGVCTHLKSPCGAVGIDGFGIRVPFSRPLDMNIRSTRSRHWQLSALLVKKHW